MEKEEGILTRKSWLNILIVKVITVITNNDNNVKITDICHPNDQEKPENF